MDNRVGPGDEKAPRSIKKPSKKSDKKNDNNKNKAFVKNTIDLNPTIDDKTMGEAKDSGTAVFTWGRMNPPTVGHEKLVNKVKQVAQQNNAMPHIYLTQTYDSKKNPIPYGTKIRLAQKAFGNIVSKSKSKTLIQVMKELQTMGHNKVIMVVGSDRVQEFKTLLNRYNGKDFSFESINVVSAGNRDPDADSVSGMSATKMREAAAANDMAAFKKGLPQKLQSQAAKIMQTVRDGMQIAEELEEQGLLDEAVLSIAQRRKRAMAFRRARARIKRGRMIAKRKFAPKAKLEKRARRAAIKLIRRRVAGKKGLNYANLSPGEKMSVDRLVQRRQGAIKTIAKRLLPKVRTAERERLQRYHASQTMSKEEFDDCLNIIMEAYFKVDIEGLPKFFMDASSPGEVKVELRRLLKKPGEVVNDITRVQKADIIKAFRLQAAGKSDEGGKVGIEEDIDTAFTNYLFEREDPDIKDREGTQPAKYFSGLSVSTKKKRDAHFKKHGPMADDDPKGYKPAPGDASAETKPSKHTKRYHQMFGKEQNMKFDKRFRFNRKMSEMTEEQFVDAVDGMLNTFEQVQLIEKQIEGLKKKSEKSGIPYSTLKKVYDRGMAAWQTGHRPGTTPQQWAFARVNSYITKGKTYHTADKDLREEAVSPAQQAAIAIAKKKSGKYDKEGNRIKEAKTHSWRSEGHYLPDGTEWTGDQHNYEGDVYTGKTHTPASQKLYHYKELPAGVRKKITLDLDEVSQVDVAKDKIKREKEADKRKHDRMMDRARTTDTRAANRAEEVDIDEMAKRVRDEPGAYTMKQGKTEYKLTPRLNRNDRPSGEWQIYVKDRGNWEWDRTVGGKRDAINWIKTQKEEVVHDKCGTPECCGQCDTSDLNEAFVAAGFSDIMYANDFEEHKVHGGFALHPSVTEEGGAGDWGTNKLTKKYKKDTPGQNVKEAIEYMDGMEIDFCENIYRPLSDKYFEFFREARQLYEAGELQLEGVNKQLILTDIGEFAYYEDMEVPLDCPLLEEDEPELNKPKRGGTKKFYVYVKDPSTDNVKKVSWGDTTGLKTKINNPAARKSFAARHKCDTRNDKTTASYWACRLPRYAKMLGMQVDNPNSWW